MTAKEIRNIMDILASSKLNDEQKRNANNRLLAMMAGEIAAQLAELNEHLAPLSDYYKRKMNDEYEMVYAGSE